MLASHFTLAAGDAGTAQTVAHMRRLVQAATGDPLVRSAAAALGVGPGGTRGTAQARAIRDYVETRTVFLRDPSGRELLHHPRVLLQAILRRGYAAVDCDDVAILSAALGKAIGLLARFVVVGFGARTAPYRHVWTELADPVRQQWVEMDVTRPAQRRAAIGRVAIYPV